MPPLNLHVFHHLLNSANLKSLTSTELEGKRFNKLAVHIYPAKLRNYITRTTGNYWTFGGGGGHQTLLESGKNSTSTYHFKLSRKKKKKK